MKLIAAKYRDSGAETLCNVQKSMEFCGVSFGWQFAVRGASVREASFRVTYWGVETVWFSGITVGLPLVVFPSLWSFVGRKSLACDLTWLVLGPHFFWGTRDEMEKAKIAWDSRAQNGK